MSTKTRPPVRCGEWVRRREEERRDATLSWLAYMEAQYRNPNSAYFVLRPPSGEPT